MSSRSVSDIQTRAEGRRREFVYQIQIGFECFIVLKNDPPYFIGEVILKINIV